MKIRIANSAGFCYGVRRAVAPLRQAEDAVLLDTTELGLEESLKALISLVKARLAQ